MRTKNIAFENSLACLQHPLTLLSIAILLLNDHVLKVVSPSWWTGKLSDFAGLFFFPFIVAAGLSLILSKFNFSRQRVGQIAFGIVAVWFALLKTVPFVNSLTAQFASLFIGAPARLILDPTDLIALVVLFPAWKLWLNQANVAVFRKAYISLAVGVVACLASMPPIPPFEDVVALSYRDGYLYARSSTTNDWYIVRSKDKGENWEREMLSSEKSLEGERILPIQVCDPVSVNICYRIDGTDKIFKSANGGHSWQTVWAVPPERREYISHVSGELKIYDAIIAQDGDARYLFVAMGGQGVLRRQLPDGDWIQLGVEDAQPAPFYAMDIQSALDATRNELIIWSGVAFLALQITQIGIWKRLQGTQNNHGLKDWIKRVLLSATTFIAIEMTITFGIILIFVVDAYTFLLIPMPIAMAVSNALSDPIIVLVIVLLEIVALFAWLLVRTNNWIRITAPDLKARHKIIIYCAMTVIGVYLIGILPWPLWALGVIERYQWTLFISISVSVLITALGYRLIRNAK